MKPQRLWLALVLNACLLASVAHAAAPDPALVALVERAKKESAHLTQGSGISQELQDLEKRIVAFGPAAAPLMVPLLAHKSEGIRTYAAYVVSGLPALTPKELPALIASYRGGNGWIPTAIGKVGNREAVDFLVAEFRKTPDVQGQLDWALIKLGRKAAGTLAAQLRGPATPPNRLVEGTCHVFREMKEEAADAEPVLVALAQEPNVSLDTKAAALKLLGCLPVVSPATRAMADALADADPKLAVRVGYALFKMQTPRGVQFILAQVKQHPSRVIELAELGLLGRQAEPLVVSLLQHASPTMRLEAAEALGAIGTSESAPALLPLLDDARDWRAPCAAARAVVSLRAVKALGAIEAVALRHWYPPVRECARVAAAALKEGKPAERHWRHWDVPDGKKWRAQPPLGTDDPNALALADLARETVPSEEKALKPRLPAQTGLKFAGGLLLGTDQGEWGGRLIWKGPTGEKNLVVSDFHGDTNPMVSNVVALHSLGAFAVSIHGLAHMGINEGSVYRVDRSANGTVAATLWRILPGEPEKTVRLDDGSLYLSCRGGDVILRPDGTLRMAIDAKP